MRTVQVTKGCSTGTINTRRAVGHCAGRDRVVRLGSVYSTTPHDNACESTTRLVKHKK